MLDSLVLWYFMSAQTGGEMQKHEGFRPPGAFHVELGMPKTMHVLSVLLWSTPANQKTTQLFFHAW